MKAYRWPIYLFIFHLHVIWNNLSPKFIWIILDVYLNSSHLYITGITDKRTPPKRRELWVKSFLIKLKTTKAAAWHNTEYKDLFQHKYSCKF